MMTIKFALIGLLISLLAFISKNDCDFGCEYIIFEWLALLGVFYFLAVIFLFKYRYYSLIWLLSAGVGVHTCLTFIYAINGGFCPWCLVAYAANIAVLMTVIKKKHLVITFIIVFLSALAAYHIIPVPSSEHLAVDTQNKVTTTDSMIHEQMQTQDIHPEIITVYDLDGKPVEIDLLSKQVLIWSPYCEACMDVLPVIGHDVALLAVWIEGEEDIKLASEKAESFGRNTYITGEHTNINASQIPKILKWNPNESQIDYDGPGEIEIWQ